MEHMELHYEAWAKAGIGTGYGLNDLKNYILKLNWLSHWTSRILF